MVKGKGWHNEHKRHQLAGAGIKTYKKSNTELTSKDMKIADRKLNKKEYIVMNDTDGIVASPNTFKTKEEAQQYINDFPKRYEHQGYYLTSNRERINPKSVKLRITEEDKF